MKEYIVKRAVELAEFIIENQTTVRDAGHVFNISKSTVHKDITERLQEIDKELYKEVHEVLKNNFQERHLRGGLATKNKYSKHK